MAINMSMCLFVSSFCCGKTCHCIPLLKMLIGEDMNWPRKTMCVSFKPTLPRKWHQPNNVWGFQILSLISSRKTYFYGEQLDNIKEKSLPYLAIFFPSGYLKHACSWLAILKRVKYAHLCIAGLERSRRSPGPSLGSSSASSLSTHSGSWSRREQNSSPRTRCSRNSCGNHRITSTAISLGMGVGE